MGTFIYDTVSTSIEIDDRTLAHVRLVTMTKLRRAEPFMFDVDMHDGSGRRSFWIHPSVPLQFRFWGSRPIPLNRLWIEQLMVAASGPNGLSLMPEPIETVETFAAGEHAVRHAVAADKRTDRPVGALPV